MIKLLQTMPDKMRSRIDFYNINDQRVYTAERKIEKPFIQDIRSYIQARIHIT